MKTAQDYLKEANEIVEKIDTLDAIKKHGITPIHRKTFKGVIA